MEPNTHKPLSNCCCVSWKSDIATGGLECVKPSSCYAKRKWKSKLLFALRPSESISSLRNHRTSFFFFFFSAHSKTARIHIYCPIYTLILQLFNYGSALFFSFNRGPRPMSWMASWSMSKRPKTRPMPNHWTNPSSKSNVHATVVGGSLRGCCTINNFFFFFLTLAGFCSSSPKSPTSPNESSASCSSQPSRSALPPSCGKWKSFKECAR